ncbi:MAG: tagatose 1,6-diphosphate aldolase [Candidatus Limnocylindrales bacterium]|jgi:tagatose 1,6-diphosphate aldolase
MSTNLPLGVVRGLDACALPSGKFVLLSIDVRQRLRAELNPTDPNAVSAAEMIEFKRTVVRSLGPVVTGSLLDPEMGAGHCLIDATQPGQRGLVVALEETGYVGPATDRLSRQLEGWSVEKAKRMGASAAKLLVYYHADAASASLQESFLERVAAECLRSELPLFVETLVFSPQTGGNLTGQLRTEAIIEAARRLSAVGGDVYMAQFPGDPALGDGAASAEACAALNEACSKPWLLLAGPADFGTYVCQAELAATAGASGILAGKTVWGDALTLGPVARTEFLGTTGCERVRQLTDLVEGRATPWRTPAAGALVGSLAEGWYRDY